MGRSRAVSGRCADAAATVRNSRAAATPAAPLTRKARAHGRRVSRGGSQRQESQQGMYKVPLLWRNQIYTAYPSKETTFSFPEQPRMVNSSAHCTVQGPKIPPSCSFIPCPAPPPRPHYHLLGRSPCTPISRSLLVQERGNAELAHPYSPGEAILPALRVCGRKLGAG